MSALNYHHSQLSVYFLVIVLSIRVIAAGILLLDGSGFHETLSLTNLDLSSIEIRLLVLFPPLSRFHGSLSDSSPISPLSQPSPGPSPVVPFVPPPSVLSPAAPPLVAHQTLIGRVGNGPVVVIKRHGRVEGLRVGGFADNQRVLCHGSGSSLPGAEAQGGTQKTQRQSAGTGRGVAVHGVHDGHCRFPSTFDVWKWVRFFFGIYNRAVAVEACLQRFC